jgi:hypothetical protein
MEVDLVARPNIGALEVDRELAAQLGPGVEGPLGEIHEPRPVHPSQGYRKVVGHDDLIISCRKDGGRVDLQEFDVLTVLSYFCDRWSQNLCGKTTIRRCGTSATHPPPPRNFWGARGCGACATGPQRTDACETKSFMRLQPSIFRRLSWWRSMAVWLSSPP